MRTLYANRVEEHPGGWVRNGQLRPRRNLGLHLQPPRQLCRTTPILSCRPRLSKPSPPAPWAPISGHPKFCAPDFGASEILCPRFRGIRNFVPPISGHTDTEARTRTGPRVAAGPPYRRRASGRCYRLGMVPVFRPHAGERRRGRTCSTTKPPDEPVRAARAIDRTGVLMEARKVGPSWAIAASTSLS